MNAILPAELAALVDAAMARIRTRHRDDAPSRDSLRDTLADMHAIAVRADLFNTANFPLDPKTQDGIYLLSEDPDRRLALYLGARIGRLETPPHDHTTWAAIAGVHGEEHNTFFDRATGEPGGVSVRGRETVVRGTGVAMLAAELHAIRTNPDELNMQLHLYGRSFDAQGGRIFIDPTTGTDRPFAGHPQVRVPTGRVTAAMLKRLLADGQEIALLDLRDVAVFSEAGHPLLAANLPLDRLEFDIQRRVPNRAARIALLDDHGLAQAAVPRLHLLGYRNLFILPGGSAAWSAAGYELFTGINVPSKAFGEWVAEHEPPPDITAGELKAMMDAKRPFALFDCRTPAEHARMTLPGSINAPGSELVARALAADPSLPIVIHCAGRTRGIVSGRALIDAGIPNPVRVLRNGMIGWLLAGYRLQMAGERSPLPALKPSPAHDAHEVDALKVESWLTDTERTTYLFDVRTADEYADGHFPSARHAPGGELLQQTDWFAPVRRARIVVHSGDARAVTVARLLRRMDWAEVFVLAGRFRMEKGAAAPQPPQPRGWRPPFDETEQDPARMQAYIDWEHELPPKLDRDGGLHFQ